VTVALEASLAIVVIVAVCVCVREAYAVGRACVWLVNAKSSLHLSSGYCVRTEGIAVPTQTGEDPSTSPNVCI